MKKLKEFNNLVEKILKEKEELIAVISDFLGWFKRKLEMQFFTTDKKFIPKKGDIFYVNLGRNIGTELNKIRPCVVISKRKYNAGGSILIVPLRSYKGKDKNIFIKIFPDKENNLGKISQIDILAIKQVDKKRLLNKIGILNEKYLIEIDKILLKILDIKK